MYIYTFHYTFTRKKARKITAIFRIAFSYMAWYAGALRYLYFMRKTVFEVLIDINGTL